MNEVTSTKCPNCGQEQVRNRGKLNSLGIEMVKCSCCGQDYPVQWDLVPVCMQYAYPFENVNQENVLASFSTEALRRELESRV